MKRIILIYEISGDFCKIYQDYYLISSLWRLFIQSAFVALYRVHTIYVRDVRGRARFHPERKVDENALAVNNIGRVSKARTRAYKEIKSTWPHSIPQPRFQLFVLCIVLARLLVRTMGWIFVPIGKGNNH